MAHRRALAFAVILALAASAFAQAAPKISPFSADMKMTGAEGNSATGKIYWGGSKIRMDMDAQDHEVSIIQGIPGKTSYMLIHPRHMYVEMNAGDPLSPPMRTPDMKPYDPADPCANREGYTCEKVGSETVNGRACDKWEFNGAESNQTVWIDQKLHFPIRSVASDGGTLEVSNVKEGAQPASLFEIPSGYTKMDMSGMMGGRHRPDD